MRSLFKRSSSRRCGPTLYPVSRVDQPKGIVAQPPARHLSRISRECSASMASIRCSICTLGDCGEKIVRRCRHSPCRSFGLREARKVGTLLSLNAMSLFHCDALEWFALSLRLASRNFYREHQPIRLSFLSNNFPLAMLRRAFTTQRAVENLPEDKPAFSESVPHRRRKTLQDSLCALQTSARTFPAASELHISNYRINAALFRRCSRLQYFLVINRNILPLQELKQTGFKESFSFQKPFIGYQKTVFITIFLV